LGLPLSQSDDNGSALTVRILSRSLCLIALQATDTIRHAGCGGLGESIGVPTCPEEANVNGDTVEHCYEKIGVSDVAYMIDYLFGIPIGPAPKPCP
jgi:hypothetical protein